MLCLPSLELLKDEDCVLFISVSQHLAQYHKFIDLKEGKGPVQGYLWKERESQGGAQIHIQAPLCAAVGSLASH